MKRCDVNRGLGSVTDDEAMATFEQSAHGQRVTVVVGVPVDPQVVGAIKNMDGRIDVLCHDPHLEPAARQRMLAVNG